MAPPVVRFERIQMNHLRWAKKFAHLLVCSMRRSISAESAVPSRFLPFVCEKTWCPLKKCICETERIVISERLVWTSIFFEWRFSCIHPMDHRLWFKWSLEIVCDKLFALKVNKKSVIKICESQDCEYFADTPLQRDVPAGTTRTKPIGSIRFESFSNDSFLNEKFSLKGVRLLASYPGKWRRYGFQCFRSQP